MMSRAKHHLAPDLRTNNSSLHQRPQFPVFRHPESPQSPKTHKQNERRPGSVERNEDKWGIPDEGVAGAGGGVGIGEGGVEALAAAVENEGIAFRSELVADVAVHRGIHRGGEEEGEKEDATVNEKPKKTAGGGNGRIDARHWDTQEKISLSLPLSLSSQGSQRGTGRAMEPVFFFFCSLLLMAKLSILLEGRTSF